MRLQVWLLSQPRAQIRIVTSFKTAICSGVRQIKFKVVEVVLLHLFTLIIFVCHRVYLITYDLC